MIGFLNLFLGRALKLDVGVADVEGVSQFCALDEVNAQVLHVLAGDVDGGGFTSLFGVDGQVIAPQVTQTNGVPVLEFADHVLLQRREHAFDVVFGHGALVADVLRHAVKIHVTDGFDGGIEGGLGEVLGILFVSNDVINHLLFLSVWQGKSTISGPPNASF